MWASDLDNLIISLQQHSLISALKHQTVNILVNKILCILWFTGILKPRKESINVINIQIVSSLMYNTLQLFFGKKAPTHVRMNQPIVYATRSTHCLSQKAFVTHCIFHSVITWDILFGLKATWYVLIVNNCNIFVRHRGVIEGIRKHIDKWNLTYLNGSSIVIVVKHP